jgi:3-oxoacyl-(acyl-carrier-protein) synthase
LRPDENAEGLRRAVKKCLGSQTRVDFAVLDGLANSEKDYAEVLAISSSLFACKVSSVQSFAGMLLGALGSTQVAAGVLALSNVRFKQNKSFRLMNLRQPLELTGNFFDGKVKTGVSKVLVAGSYLGGGNYSVLLGK